MKTITKSPYGIHPSRSLQELYRVKNYQGANPEDAKVLFVGRDPNWHYDIENMPLFEKVTEYLSDGIGFWEKYNIHHPFLLADYKGDGKRYHRMFSNLKIDSDLADKISFVELIGFPTMGMAKRSKGLYESHLFSERNQKHLIHLDKILAANDKEIFIAWGLLEDFSILNKNTGLFEKLSNIDKSKLDIKNLNQIDNIFIHKHFSDSISSSTLSRISNEVNTYLK